MTISNQKLNGKEGKNKMGKKITLWVFVIFLGLLAMILEKPSAQEVFPTKPITLLVGFPPGGPADITARSYAPAASKLLGQPVVVLNKPGAGGTVAIDFVAVQNQMVTLS